MTIGLVIECTRTINVVVPADATDEELLELEVELIEWAEWLQGQRAF